MSSKRQTAKLKIKKGDRVRVLSGKDKGKEGEVMFVDPAAHKAIVEGVNVAKRHQKPTRAMQQGGIIDKAMPIHVSNLMLVCSKDGPVKVGYRIDPNGEKHRVCRKCGAEL